MAAAVAPWGAAGPVLGAFAAAVGTWSTCGGAGAAGALVASAAVAVNALPRSAAGSRQKEGPHKRGALGRRLLLVEASQVLQQHPNYQQDGR